MKKSVRKGQAVPNCLVSLGQTGLGNTQRRRKRLANLFLIFFIGFRVEFIATFSLHTTLFPFFFFSVPGQQPRPQTGGHEKHTGYHSLLGYPVEGICAKFAKITCSRSLRSIFFYESHSSKKEQPPPSKKKPELQLQAC